MGSHEILSPGFGSHVPGTKIFGTGKAAGRALDKSYTGIVFSHPFNLSYNMPKENSVLLVLPKNHGK